MPCSIYSVVGYDCGCVHFLWAWLTLSLVGIGLSWAVNVSAGRLTLHSCFSFSCLNTTVQGLIHSSWLNHYHSSYILHHPLPSPSFASFSSLLPFVPLCTEQVPWHYELMSTSLTLSLSLHWLPTSTAEIAHTHTQTENRHSEGWSA